MGEFSVSDETRSSSRCARVDAAAGSAPWICPRRPCLRPGRNRGIAANWAARQWTGDEAGGAVGSGSRGGCSRGRGRGSGRRWRVACVVRRREEGEVCGLAWDLAARD